MDLEFTISEQEAGLLQVDIAENRAVITGLASGRAIVFEGLFSNITVKLLPAQEQEQPGLPSIAPPEVTADQQPDPQLFGKLATLRKQISSEVKLPPYIIFHDSTLKEMCRRLPADLQALGEISGVGEAKLTKYGSRFLEVIREYLKTPGKAG